MNRTTSTIVTSLTAAAVLGGLFLSPLGPGNDKTAPADDVDTTAQTVVITAQDSTNDKKLPGFKIRVIDPDGANVGQEHTTGSNGLATVVVPGAKNVVYRIVAVAPDPAWQRDGDSDGQTAYGDLACADILNTFDPNTCIYMKRDANGDLTMPNRGTSRDEDTKLVDQAQFVFQKPTTTTEPDEPTAPIEPIDDEIVIGAPPIDEQSTDDSDATTFENENTENAQETTIDAADSEPVAVEEEVTVCAGVVHQSPSDAGRFPSRIEIDVDAGPAPRDLSIVIPGANDGQPKVVNVAVGGHVFGINSYGDYRIGTVLLDGVDVTTAFAQLPTITVTDGDAVLWCTPITITAATATVTVTEEAEDVATTTTEQASAFVAAFSDAHESGDADTLLAGLHPAARDAFGADACDMHIRNTTGLIGDIDPISFGDPSPYEFATPSGTISFDNAIAVEANWIEQGVSINDVTFHLIADGDEIRYLSTCGQPTG